MEGVTAGRPFARRPGIWLKMRDAGGLHCEDEPAAGLTEAALPPKVGQSVNETRKAFPVWLPLPDDRELFPGE